MTHSLTGVDDEAIMCMKVAVPSELRVECMKSKDGRFWREECVALRKCEVVDVPTGDNYTTFFETDAVVGPSVGVQGECNVQIMVLEDQKRHCFFKSENLRSKETVKLSLCFDRNLTLHCFVTAGDQRTELEKHSFFVSGEKLRPEFFSLQGCVRDAWEQLRKQKAGVEQTAGDVAIGRDVKRRWLRSGA